MELLSSRFFSIITEVEEGSISEELGIEVGDILVSINGKEIEDIIEYEYHLANEEISLEIRHRDGSSTIYDIEKDYDEDLGLQFENPIMNQIKVCSNKCSFCFIDQLPKGMRKTLYIKDDDSRLSFLQGNYITLTNMKEKDLQKIIEYKISPINISVHTTDKELRVKMLKNPNAANILEMITRLKDAGIYMNAQIVLVRDENDKENLEKTVNDLGNLHPFMQSIAVVPVGLTKYRDNLPYLKSFDKSSAKGTIDLIHNLQEKSLEKFGERKVHLSDEFYIIAEEKFPDYENYEGFPQLENGVGMIVKHRAEFEKSLKKYGKISKKRRVSMATGAAAYEYIKTIANELMEKHENLEINVHRILNDFFGHTITVAGLITASDLESQLKDKDLGDELILPETMLKSGEEIFLDSVYVSELEESLKIPIRITKNDGESFIKDALGI